MKKIILILFMLLVLPSCSFNNKPDEPVSEVITEEDIPDSKDKTFEIKETEKPKKADKKDSRYLEGYVPYFDETVKKYGYMYNDKIIVEPKYEIAYPFYSKYKRAEVGYNIKDEQGRTSPYANLTGYIDLEGNEVIPPIYNQIGNFDESEGVTYALKGKYYGLIDYNNNIITDFQYDRFLGGQSIGSKGKTNLGPEDFTAKVGKNGKNGLINYKGEVLVEVKYDALRSRDIKSSKSDKTYYDVFPFYRVIVAPEDSPEHFMSMYKVSYYDFNYEIIDQDQNVIYSSPILRVSEDFYNEEIFMITDFSQLKKETVNINGFFGPQENRMVYPYEVSTQDFDWGEYKNEPEYEVVIVDENTPYEMVSIEDLEKRINN